VSGNSGAIQNPRSLMQSARRLGSNEHLPTLTAAAERCPEIVSTDLSRKACTAPHQKSRPKSSPLHASGEGLGVGVVTCAPLPQPLFACGEGEENLNEKLSRGFELAHFSTPNRRRLIPTKTQRGAWQVAFNQRFESLSPPVGTSVALSHMHIEIVGAISRFAFASHIKEERLCFGQSL
jgi:hypothetical protein